MSDSKNISALARISHVGPYVRTYRCVIEKRHIREGRECRIRSGAPPPPPEILDCLSLASYHIQQCRGSEQTRHHHNRQHSERHHVCSTVV